MNVQNSSFSNSQPVPNLDPVPSGDDRKALSKQVRDEATDVAAERAANAQPVPNNGETQSVVPPVATFTKSLKHNIYGFVDPQAFSELLSELSQPKPNPKSSPLPGTYDSQRRAPFKVTLAPSGKTPKHVYIAHHGQEELDGSPRTYESPLAGHTFDLQAPDADQFSIPPAPTLGSAELTAEMAEVYAMALLRDVPFSAFRDSGPDDDSICKDIDFTVAEAVDELQKLDWFNGVDLDLTDDAERRRDARTGGAALSAQTIFRGSTEGSRKGPYLSQFLVRGSAPLPDREPATAAAAGSASKEETSQDLGLLRSPAPVSPTLWELVPAGRRAPAGSATFATEAATSGDSHDLPAIVVYGPMTIPTTMVPHRPCLDYMQTWADWLDVQNGLNSAQRVHGHFGLVPHDIDPDFIEKAEARVITTPRDLATYVHYDALYQAYLNACLTLIAQGASTDAGLPEGGGHPSRGAFATFGSPHILTLVTEVATRALKTVRRSKFQHHLRARPEAIGGVLTVASSDAAKQDAEAQGATFFDAARAMQTALDATTIGPKLKAYNGKVDLKGGMHDAALVEGPREWLDEAQNWLLPMAFPEGSPTHGSYGAGHATVAGACVTVLKAFFEMFDIEKICGFKPGDLYRGETNKDGKGGLSLSQMIDLGPKLFGHKLPLDKAGPIAEQGVVEPRLDRKTGKSWLKFIECEQLMLEDELDKLAANISIGRNFAGVHYYTDYYESLRLGERIAVGMLQEQMLTYREPVSMRFTSFDGDRIMIVGTGGSVHGHQNGKYDSDDAQVLVWPKGNDAPEWTTFEHTRNNENAKHREEAIKAEAAKWWTQGR